jgi:hypothetical protein
MFSSSRDLNGVKAKMTQPRRHERTADDNCFLHYLRTGERFTMAQWHERERKFNTEHDERGRFTFSGRGVASSGPDSVHMGRGAAGGTAGTAGLRTRKIRSKQERQQVESSRRDDDIGALSAKYESGGRGPGTISSGRADPGGVSYGTHQLSSNGKMVDAFIASPMAARWSQRFRNLRPTTPEFDAQWRAVAAAEPAAFSAAQNAFLGRENYKRTVRGVAQDTGANLNGAANAVRQVAWSVAIQHGGARTILTAAVRRTDRSLRRNDPSYQRALIGNIYDERAAYTERARLEELAIGNTKKAQGLENVIKNRFPQERADALRLLDRR